MTENPLRPVMAAIRKYSNIPVTMQLAHAGRKASSHTPWDGGPLISGRGWRLDDVRAIGHSAIPHKPDETPPVSCA